MEEREDDVEGENKGVESEESVETIVHSLSKPNSIFYREREITQREEEEEETKRRWLRQDYLICREFHSSQVSLTLLGANTQ